MGQSTGAAGEESAPVTGMYSKQELSWAERIKGIPSGRGE